MSYWSYPYLRCRRKQDLLCAEVFRAVYGYSVLAWMLGSIMCVYAIHLRKSVWKSNIRFLKIVHKENNNWTHAPITQCSTDKRWQELSMMSIALHHFAELSVICLRLFIFFCRTMYALRRLLVTAARFMRCFLSTNCHSKPDRVIWCKLTWPVTRHHCESVSKRLAFYDQCPTKLGRLQHV